MSAAELREAAQRLRALASTTLPTPWIVTHEAESGADVESRSCGCAYLDPADYCANEAECPSWGISVAAATLANGACMEGDAAYIATMHPGVGLALADLLEHAAGRAESKVKHGGGEDAVWSHERDTLALARLINGDAS